MAGHKENIDVKTAAFIKCRRPPREIFPGHARSPANGLIILDAGLTILALSNQTFAGAPGLR
jgi:hypothetical protein